MKLIIFILLTIMTVYAEAQQFQPKDSVLIKLKNLVNKRISENSLDINNESLFNGKIEIINKTSIKYDDEVLIVYAEEKYKSIFENGIFFPSLITGPVKTGLERKREIESMLIRNDSLTVSNFVEIENYYKTYDKREFSFLIFHKRFTNPTEYHITLTNKNINTETDLETFVKGAIATKLTYITLWI